MKRSNKYIFKRKEDVKLLFQSNFEDYFQNDEESYDQNSNNSDISGYCKFSIVRIIKTIQELKSNKNILEIGCGQIFVTKIDKPRYLTKSVTVE